MIVFPLLLKTLSKCMIYIGESNLASVHKSMCVMFTQVILFYNVFQALIHGLNRHYYSIAINYRKNELEQKVCNNYCVLYLQHTHSEKKFNRSEPYI